MMKQPTTDATLPTTHAELLRRIARWLAVENDSGAFLYTALEELRALLRTTLAQILLLDTTGARLVPAATVELVFVAQPLAIEMLPDVRAALDRRQVTQIDDTAQSTLVAQLDLPPDELGALLFAPLMAEGELLGVLLIGLPPQRPFSAEDVLLLELVAAALTVAVYTERLNQGVELRNEQLAMVADIATDVTSSLEPDEVYRLVVGKLNQYFRVAAGSLLRRDEVTDELFFLTTLEGGTEKLRGIRIPPGVGIAGHVARTQQPYITNHVQTDPLHYDAVERQVGMVVETNLSVPMVVKGQTVGVIQLINKLDGLFTHEDAQKLHAVAGIIGVAIENARLFEFVHQRRNRLEALLNQIVQHTVSHDALIDALARELAAQDQLLAPKFNNPYIVGMPIIRPEMCFGREQLLQMMLSVLHQNSLLLYGPRRIGKTTLLQQLELRLRALDDPQYTFEPIFIDLQGIVEAHFFAHLMEEIVEYVGEPAQSLKLRYMPDHTAYSGRDFYRDLRLIIKHLVQQAAGTFARLILLIDEADVMQSYDERVLQEFRRCFMSKYAAHFGVVLSTVHVRQQWSRYESPLYNLFQQIEVPALNREATEELARMPVWGMYTYDEAAIDRIYELTGGQPMNTQLLCLEAINAIREQGRTNVTVEDVERVSQAIQGQSVWL
jgi:GAF domain-containing protein